MILFSFFKSKIFQPAHLIAGFVILEEVLHVDLNLHLLGDKGLEELDNLLG